MSDATGRCFPLNMLSLSLSLSQSVYSCFPFSLHLKFLLLTARPKGFFPPHTKGHFSITCSLFCKKCTHSSVTLSPVCFLPSLSSRNTVVKVPDRLSPQRYVATERVWFFLGINDWGHMTGISLLNQLDIKWWAPTMTLGLFIHTCVSLFWACRRSSYKSDQRPSFISELCIFHGSQTKR